VIDAETLTLDEDATRRLREQRTAAPVG
jgi:hypothetical protein